ncbi:MAG: hypothetical protein OXB90_06910 [Acidimicrobiaceae bacterium]|nr:hypothetical protein [Acidimicrobiaceae bacterium]
MARLGSDVDEMEVLARSFQSEANRMRSSANEINSMMRDLRWWGPFHDFFLGWWDSKEYKWLLDLADSLDGLGETVGRQAAEQTRASMPGGVRVNDAASTKFLYNTVFGGGKKVGLLVEYLPEYRVSADYFQYVNAQGESEMRGNASVFVADQWGIDLGDLEAVAFLASGGASGSKFVADALFGGPNVGGSISGGVGREYSWYDQDDSQARGINKYYTNEATSWMNRLDKFDQSDVLRAIEKGEIPPYDSVTNWLMYDARLDVSSTQGLVPNVSVGTDVSLLYGSEIFADGGTAKIVQGELSVDTSGDIAGLQLLDDYEFSGLELGGTVAMERKLIFDDAGSPVTLEIMDSVGVTADIEKGLIVSETRTSEESLVTTFTYDLTDPQVAEKLDVGNGEDLLSISAKAMNNRDLAFGESHILDSDGNSVSFDFYWALGMDEYGETGSAKEAMIKPVGSQKFIPRQ